MFTYNMLTKHTLYVICLSWFMLLNNSYLKKGSIKLKKKQKLFLKIEKWTKKKCPKSQIAKKFLRKKAEKTI